MWVLTPIYVRRLRRRAQREPAFMEREAERFAHYEIARTAGVAGSPRHPLVWVHAVSADETRGASPLIKALRQAWPGMSLLLTCSTATGLAAGRELIRPGDRQTWLPYDSPDATRRFFAAWKPSVGVIMETEIWPNLMRAAAQARVPMVLANACLTRRGYERGGRYEALLRPALQAFDRVLAQSIGDAQRFRELGAERVEVSGNLRFDIEPLPKLVAKGIGWRTEGTRQVVLMAASREGEEAKLLEAWRQVPVPRPILLVVPRLLHRVGDVAALAKLQGFSCVRRSDWGASPSLAHWQADIWIGDTEAEMPVYYGCSDVCLLGGSFAKATKQHLIEAVACGCPVVLGPHGVKRVGASDMALQSRAAMQATDMEDGVHKAVALARDVQRNEWVERALNFAAMHRGATQRTMERIVASVDARADD